MRLALAALALLAPVLALAQSSPPPAPKGGVSVNLKALDGLSAPAEADLGPPVIIDSTTAPIRPPSPTAIPKTPSFAPPDPKAAPAAKPARKEATKPAQSTSKPPASKSPGETKQPAKAAPAPAPAEAVTKLAAAPSAGASVPQAAPQPKPAAPPLTGVRVLYQPTEASPDPASQGVLNSLIETLKQAPDQRIELRAFATAGSDQSSESSEARRIALNRALLLREALVQRGIARDRIDIRALGASQDGAPADRVDIVAQPS